MSLTLCGYLCILLMLTMLVRCKFKLYMLPTMPLFMILLSYWRYFAHYERIDLLPEVDVILLYSFVVFLLFYAIGKRLKIRWLEKGYICLSESALVEGNIFTRTKSISIYLLIVILYCIYDLWVNTLLYGSLENALIRFYGKPVESDLPSMLKTSLQFSYKAVVAFLFVFRLYLNKCDRHSNKLYLAVLLLMLIAFPRGSRGALVTPLVMLVTADMFTVTYIKKYSLKRNMKEYVVAATIGIVLMLTLTVVRNVNFEDLSQAYEAISELNLGEAFEKYEKGEGDLILSDTQFCYEKFGKDVPFLSPFYTLKTLVFAMVPRALMPSKPVSFGYVLNEVKLGGSSLDPEKLNYPSAVNWAAGYAGEGWANGGMFGVTFYAVIFGLLSGVCSKMYYLLFKRMTPLSVLFALLFFGFSSGTVRGDLLAGFALNFYPLLILTLLFAFIKWTRKRLVIASNVK